MLDDLHEIPPEMAPENMPEDLEALPPEALRTRVRDYVSQNSTSYKAVATLVGSAESTFTAWVANKYKGDNEGVENKVRRWLRNEQAVRAHQSLLPSQLGFVRTPTAMKFISTLEYAQAMPEVVVISAVAGVGKTSSLKHYQATRSNVHLLTSEPSLSSHSKMMEYLREILGIPETARHQVSRAVAAKLADTKALLIFDEAQHMAPKCLDQIRSVFDRAGVGIALVGNEEVWGRIHSGGRKNGSSQLYSRVGMQVTVMAPTPKDIEAMLDAAGIVDKKCRALLMTIGMKPGALRGMTKTLQAAHLAAAGGGQDLDERHITIAWNRRMGQRESAL
jgi:DNA transposition AAA+ family ATPase